MSENHLLDAFYPTRLDLFLYHWLPDAIATNNELQEILYCAVSFCKTDLDLFLNLALKYEIDEAFAKKVAAVIKEHYKPRIAKDDLPENLLSVYLSFIDKLDTLIVHKMLGAKVTANSDQHGLRRTAKCLAKIISENKFFEIDLDLILNNKSLQICYKASYKGFYKHDIKLVFQDVGAYIKKQL